MVLVILGILAGVAAPVYTNTVEQSRSNEAQVNLNTIYMAQKIYFANNGSYWAVASNPTFNDGSATDINKALSINLTTSYYTINAITTTAGPPATFTAKATRNGGNWINRFATIIQDGTYTAP